MRLIGDQDLITTLTRDVVCTTQISYIQQDVKKQREGEGGGGGGGGG